MWPANGAATLNHDEKVGQSRTAHRPRMAFRSFPGRAVALGALGGLALYTAFPPLGWWPIAVPAVAAITLACRGRSWRVGLLVGLATGLAEFVPLIQVRVSLLTLEDGAVPRSLAELLARPDFKLAVVRAT